MASVIEKKPAIPVDPIYPLSVTQYHAMIRAGILTSEDKIELLQGWLIPKMPKNPAHRAATRLIRQALEQIIPDDWYVDSQEPITTLDSEPEPDVVVVRGNTRDYLDRHPGPDDLALVIEVSDATLRRDQTLKKSLYASAGIAVYWVVNLSEQQLIVYQQPTGMSGQPDYQQQTIYRIGDTVAVIIDQVEAGSVVLQDILP